MKVEIFNDAGKPVRGEKGELVCTKPFPSMPVAFWNDPGGEKYRAAYFEDYPGVWRHGDWAELTGHDGLIIYGRSDATLNPGGVRIGTAEIYRQVEQFDEVVESLVIGQDWRGDLRIVLFVRLRDGLSLSNEIKEQHQQAHPGERQPASRAAQDHSSGRHPAHDQRQDHRVGRARRHSRPAGQKPRRAGESRSIGPFHKPTRVAGRLSSGRYPERNQPSVFGSATHDCPHQAGRRKKITLGE